MQEKVLCGVVSLLDMMEYYAHIYLEWTNKLTAWEKVSGESRRDVQVKPDYAMVLYAEISVFFGMCKAHGFNSTARQCERMVEMFKRSRQNNDSLTCGPLREELSALRKRLEDELENHKFFHLSPIEAHRYNEPWEGWQNVTNRWGVTIRDIEEMNKCFAFNRYTAAMYHALQVAELGAIELGNCIGVTDPKKGWGATERELRKLVKSGHAALPAGFPVNYEFLEQMHREIDSMALAWRHKIDHAANHLAIVPNTDFTPDIAAHIIDSVKVFMNRLVEGLP